MKKRKKRRLNPKFKTPLIIAVITSVLLVILDIFVFNNIHFLGVKSVNENANKYQTKTCLAFYPETKNGRKVVIDMCNNASKEKETIYDYALIPYGDYYLVEYGNGHHYYINKQTKEPLEIKSISDDGKKVISDYLRYNMKKAEKDEAYTFEFLNETKEENIDISTCEYEVKGDNLAVYFPKYDYTFEIPLKYVQKYAGINLGYDNENYVKPNYVSKNRKTVALTFDDGPKEATSPAILNALHNYDGAATFFVYGDKLNGKNVEIIKKGIASGNQYGSHTATHPHLPYLSAEEIKTEIMGPANDLINGYDKDPKYAFEGIGYQMSIYRAPYGEHDEKVDAVAPFISIEWDLDSEDWKSRDKDTIMARIHHFEEKNPDALDGCIILFHDTYDSTVETIDELVPELIKKGYQLVTIDELLDVLNISKERAYYPW